MNWPLCQCTAPGMPCTTMFGTFAPTGPCGCRHAELQCAGGVVGGVAGALLLLLALAAAFLLVRKRNKRIDPQQVACLKGPVLLGVVSTDLT